MAVMKAAIVFIVLTAFADSAYAAPPFSLLSTLLSPTIAPAGGLCPSCTVPVYDGTVADNTDIAATSLSTVTPGTTYAPNAQFVASLDQVLFAGVNPQNDATLLPVTTPLPCDSYTPMVNTIAPAVASTYYGALQVVQNQENELQGENFTTIATDIQAPAELASTQGSGQAGLTIVQELQLLRQSIDTLVQVVATAELQKLDANVRSKMPRAGADCGPVASAQPVLTLNGNIP